METKPASLLLLTTSFAIRHFFTMAAKQLEIGAVLSAENASEAVSLLRCTSSVLAILIDDQTENLEIASFCTTLRILPEHHYTPIIIISNQLKKGVIRQLLKAGATDFLRHPLDPTHFLHRLEIAQKIAETEKKIAELKGQFSEIKSTPFSLKHRITFDHRAVNLLTMAMEKKLPLGLILLEIDQFAKLSSARKKTVGDALLLEAAKLLEQTLQKPDMLFDQRCGKFMLLLTKSTFEQIHLLADYIRKLFVSHPFSVAHLSFSFTVSMGLSMLRHSSAEKSAAFSLDHLLEEAQTCLNKAKKTGNTIIVAK